MYEVPASVEQLNSCIMLYMEQVLNFNDVIINKHDGTSLKLKSTLCSIKQLYIEIVFNLLQVTLNIH